MNDISSISPGTNVVEIVHPHTGDPIGLKITLRSQHSAEVQAVNRRITNDRLRTRSKNITAEKLEAAGIEVLTAAIVKWEWEGDASFGGEKLECNPQNIRRVMREAPWIKAQVDDAFGNEAAFFSN